MRVLAFLTLAACVARSVSASPSTLSFSDGKVSITTLDGSSRLTDSFSQESPLAASLAPSEGVRLESDELIRLSFLVPTVQSGVAESSSESSYEYEEEEIDGEKIVKKDVKKDSSSSSGAVPQQIAVQLVYASDPSAQTATFVPTINRNNGKVTWSQRVDRLPESIASRSNPTYILRVLLASADADAPVALDIGQVTIPFLSQPPLESPRERAARDLGFYPWEEKRHTFRKEVTEGMPGETKSLMVLGIFVTGPWLVLLLLLGSVISGVRFNFSAPIPTLVLFGSLLYLETIAVRYYRGGDFTLFKMLPYFLAGAAVATTAALSGGVKGVGARTSAGSGDLSLLKAAKVPEAIQKPSEE